MKRCEIVAKWEWLREDSIYVGEYLKKQGINRVAVYSLDELGKLLINSLREDVMNRIGIEKRVELKLSDITIVDNFLELPEVDLVIVADLENYQMIEKEICETWGYAVVSVESLILDLEYQRNRYRNKLLKDFCTTNKNVYLYGAGKIGQRCLGALRRLDCEPKGFLVSEEKDCGVLENLPIISMSQVESWDSIGIIVAVSTKFQEEIFKQLKEAGINNYITYM